MTTEQRNKMSLAKLGVLNPRFGKVGTQLGAKHSLEAKKKIKEARARQMITKEHKKTLNNQVTKEHQTTQKIKSQRT